jgi:GH15 family glucan-1,4-alpha-glucosidase
MYSKIEQLLESSRQLILDCCLENGAIVAANTDKAYYPHKVNNYRYVWPRDVSFTLYAAYLLGITNIRQPFISWLLKRAENFSEKGLIYQRYATNGPRDTEFGGQYQPDQAGALLWSLLETNEKLDKNTEQVIRLAANGLCQNWKKDHFNIPTNDLWEERQTFPELKESFSYTLASCSFGLYKAYERFKENRWRSVSYEMRDALDAFENYYYRENGKLPDKRIDASVMGMIWPFQIIPVNDKHLRSIEMVRDKLMTPLGVKRYEHDEYDGRIDDLNHWKKGAGAWPLLTFWFVIALSRTNQAKEAKRIFDSYINQFNQYIPEQVFDNEFQYSVSPLCWSHSMFVIAASELGYL